MIIGLPSGGSSSSHSSSLIEHIDVRSETTPLSPCYFRQATASDRLFLEQMLRLTVFNAKDAAPLEPNRIYSDPTLIPYHEDWGRSPDDFGFLAIRQHDNKPLGAAWIRQFCVTAPGYAVVSENTPELRMALLPKYRNQGIGAQLLARLITHAHKKRYSGLSLCVDVRNPAHNFYQRMGFEPVTTRGSLITMRYRFGKPQ